MKALDLIARYTGCKTQLRNTKTALEAAELSRDKFRKFIIETENAQAYAAWCARNDDDEELAQLIEGGAPSDRT